MTISSIKRGERLAAKHCATCHSLPDPSWLDADSWEEGVLPNMGPRLGVFHHTFKTYPSGRRDRYLDSNFYPHQPLLTATDWQNIINYYTATSPDSLPGQNRKMPIKMGLPLFTTHLPALAYLKAATSFVKIAPAAFSGSLVISDAVKQKTFFLNQQLQVTDSFSNSGPIVHMEFLEDELVACNIGVLNPNNGKFGKGEILSKDATGNIGEEPVSLFEGLQRPVQLTAADLNKDGKTDYLVCEFGFLTGALSWMENRGGTYTRHILRPLPGAIKGYIQDYNRDGLPDIWVLFAQGEEGVFLYTNKGGGKFDEQKILSFPSVNGSSYFELADFNRDGYPDIVYTCGDNADYSPVLKPYHGVYLFINDKENHFEQKFFFPINGCYKAMARDYDNDGDLDIATIAFFADYARQPEESFVYLKNNGRFIFQPYTVPEVTVGRWLTMDAGDMDGDGRIDIVLGNFSIGPSMIKSSVDWSKGPPFILLKNTGKF